MRILFTGGGTGGHIFPFIAVVRQLKERIQSQSGSQSAGSEFFFLGPDGFSRDNLEQEGIKVRTILSGKLRRYFSFRTIIDLAKIPLGIVQCLIYLFFIMPDVIFSKGGYGSVPVVLVGWLYRIPILIHESDTIPGLANRLAAKLAKKVAFSFDGSEKYFASAKSFLSGIPLRFGDFQMDKESAKRVFNISSQRPIIFIIGGSQGAQKINEITLAVLPDLLKKYEVIHQCGTANHQAIMEILGQGQLPANYHLEPFLDEGQMKAAYNLADLVVSRAGATSIFEIAAFGRPGILIPLPDSAADHQKENAFAYARTGAAVILEQANLTPHLFLNEIEKILVDAGLAQKMVEAARGFAAPGAAQKISEILIEIGE